MKNLLLVVFFLPIVLFSCKDDKEDDPTPVTNGQVYIVFENVVDGQPIELGNLMYTNEAGNIYSVDLLKYYISNISLVKSDNSEYKLGNYELINEALDTSKTFMVSVPFGNYTKMRFLLGVDSVKNISGAQAGELDPAFGMFWDWNAGYIYLKHEGNFIDAIGDTLPVAYHFGALEALTSHEVNFALPVSSTPRIVKIRFNLNKMYRSPNVIDLNNNNIHSGGSNWVNTVRENLNGAFELGSVI